MVSSTILSLFSCLIHICLSICSEVFLNLFQFFVLEFLGFEVAQHSSHGFSLILGAFYMCLLDGHFFLGFPSM